MHTISPPMREIPAEIEAGAYLPDRDFPDSEMSEPSLLDQLERLRWSILKGIGSLLIITIIASFFSSWIIDVLLLGPTRPDFFIYRLFGLEVQEVYLQNRTLTGQFFAHIGAIIATGLVIGSPVFIFFLWKFIEPIFFKEEKRSVFRYAFYISLCFILGVSFGYLIITPLALQFFANYQISDQVINEFDITKYFGMVTSWSFGVGILFELPVVIYVLAKAGIVNSGLLRRSRKYALIVALILGAIFTPPDPISQILVAMPLLGLYELSILLARSVERRAVVRRAEAV